MGKLKAGRLVGSVAVGVLATADVAMAQQSIGDMAQAGATDLAQIPDFLEVLMYLAGAVLVFAGIIKFKQASSGRDQRLGGAITTVLVGVALIALPAVYQGIADTFGVDDKATIERPTLK